MAQREASNNFADEESLSRQKTGVKRTHEITEVQSGEATDEEKNFLKNKERELHEENIKTVEEPEMEVEPEQIFEEGNLINFEDILPLKKEDLPRMPKTAEEKRVWQEWNKKLDAADREQFFHEELPTHKEIYPEEVPTAKEAYYGQKVQEAPALEEEWSPLEDKDIIDIIEVIPAEYKNGRWVAKSRAEVEQTKTELPIWLQDGHEDEGEASDVEAMWKAVTEDLARQETRKQEGITHVPFEKAPYDDWDPPTTEESKAKFLSERTETAEIPAFKHFEAKVDAIAVSQFSASKKISEKSFKRIDEIAKKIGGIASELGYKPDELRKLSGLEKLGGKLANILARSKKMTESNLSRIAGAVMVVSEEVEHFLATSHKERKLEKQREKIGRKMNRELSTKESGKDENEGLLKLRDIITGIEG
ncbi:MAG: hypothetical protein PHN19_02480 [Patescibacteria group bacterium]|nr:hypothetical protein [Patescibacteria group bacterium]